MGNEVKNSNADYSTAVGVETSSGAWVVYLLRCADRSLYAGVTSNLTRRLRQHNGELAGGARFTRARRPVVLQWQQTAADRSSAQKLEAQLRRLTRQGKERLIRSGAVLTLPTSEDVSP